MRTTREACRSRRRLPVAAGLAAFGLFLALAPATGSALERGSGASRISDARSASENWDFVVQLDNGHDLFARFAITNAGPGSGSAYVIGHVVPPDGPSLFFEKARRSGGWTLSQGGLYMQVGMNVNDQRRERKRLRIDRKGILIDLLYTAAPLGTAQDPSRDISSDLLTIGTPVAGTFKVPGKPREWVTGRLGATHYWTDESEGDVALRFLQVFSQSLHSGLYLYDFLAPDGARSQRLVIERDGETVISTTDIELTMERRLRGPLGSGYPVPRTLRIKSPNIDAEVNLRRVLASDDPLKLVPAPIRLFLRFGMNPRRIWIESEYRLTYEGDAAGAKIDLSGSGITSVLFSKKVPNSLSDF